MKNLVTFLVLVAVAFLGGFSQANGQECLNITLRNYWHDNSYILSAKQYEYLVRRAEWVINKADFPFDVTIKQDTKRIQPLVTPYYNATEKGVSQVSVLYDYLYFIKGAYNDSIVFNMICTKKEFYRDSIPGAYYKFSTCLKPTKFEKYGLNLAYLFMSDSVSLDFYANILAGCIVSGIGASPTAFDGFLLARNMWKTTDSISAVTYESISTSGKWSCLPKGTGCKTVKPSPLVAIKEIIQQKTEIIVYDRKIINDNFKFISIYDITGRPVMRSSERVIDLSNISSGIYLIQEDRKIPIKHFFY